MKRSIIITGIAAFMLAFSSCGNSAKNENTADTATSSKASVQYTCTMHPEVISDKPGECPKCGMELVKKEPANK